MVDLAKIRRKAKKQKEDAAITLEQALSESPEPAAAPPDSFAEEPAGEAEPSAGVLPSRLERFKAEAGQRRETVQTATTEESEQRVEVLTFLIAGEQYAVDIERIVEIVPPRRVTRIPNAEAGVVGIMSLRGTIVTLVDVRRTLRHPPGDVTDDTRIVVVDFHNETVGFAVDRVLRVVKLAAGEVEPHPVVHVTELEDAIRGVVRVGGALTILLDLEKLLDSRSTRPNPWN